jgi:alpha-galactosidase
VKPWGSLRYAWLLLAFPVMAGASSGAPREMSPSVVWLDSLDLSRMTQRRGAPQANKALGGTPLTMEGTVHARGIGTRSISEFVLDLKGQAERFHAIVGFDDSAWQGKPDGTVRYEIWGDDRLLADTGVMKLGAAPRPIDVDLRGIRILTLLLDDGGDTSNGDIANWADARIEMAPDSTATLEPYTAPPQPMPQIAMRDAARLSISGPLLYGTTPGKPFLYRIPASGAGSLSFAARSLPAGLTLDTATGIISGAVRDPGRFDVRLEVSNGRDRARRALRIVAGHDRLALTPPMGWNSWNVWGTAVDDRKVRAAADALVNSGLAAHGYDYVVIDDAWTSSRDANGELVPNEKFPDMKALADYVHSQGLKLGF